ncbi:MAG: hypothetical protein AAB647_02845 [Patescibacteria group bacterium]
MDSTNERTNAWLTAQLDAVWTAYFSDVPRANPVMIVFGKKARARLGSIRQKNGHTTITITGYFRNVAVPENVVHETIAHELVHYTHGFESPLPKLYRYPHEGRIVQNELASRGLKASHQATRAWLKSHWLKIVGPPKRRRLRRRRRSVWTFSRRRLRVGSTFH